MTCIHGFDENNCPTCRIARSAVPKNQDKIDNIYNNELKPYNSLMKNKNYEKGDILSKLTPHNTHFKLDSINMVPEAKLLNRIPTFENKMFSERLSELNLDKSDLFQISRKVSLKSPEMKLKEEE